MNQCLKENHGMNGVDWNGMNRMHGMSGMNEERNEIK